MTYLPLLIKTDIHIINLMFSTPHLWWCRNMTTDIIWIRNNRRCFTQRYNLRVRTLDMSRSLTTMFQLVTTLSPTSLPRPLGSPQPHMPRPSTSDTLPNDGCLVRPPMTIHIPEQLEFPWIVIIGPLSWPPVRIQKPLPPPLNRVHQAKTHGRRHRLLS